MDGHNSLNVTSLSLLYRFVNIRQIWTLLLLQNTFWHEWTRVVTLCNELLYIISFDLYTVSKTFFDAPWQNLTVTPVLYIWTLFLLLNTFLHEWLRLVKFCNELLYIMSFGVYSVSVTLFDAT
jgi:hypothetical protein